MLRRAIFVLPATAGLFPLSRSPPALHSTAAKHRIQHSYDATLYRQRHRIENMFALLKDRGRIHTRYDRCAHTFLSAVAFAANFIFWINESRP